MDATTQTHLENIRSKDKDLQNQAYAVLMQATEKPVDWAYEAWDGLVADLSHKDNHVRAIAAQLLANLAQSDPEKRMLKDFDALFNVTRDERFVTARHALQAVWKVGAAGKPQQERLVAALEQRYQECAAEKNTTLIRYDIIVSLSNLYDAVPDEQVKAKAFELIETETDTKYRKKYAGVWKNK